MKELISRKTLIDERFKLLNPIGMVVTRISKRRGADYVAVDLSDQSISKTCCTAVSFKIPLSQHKDFWKGKPVIAFFDLGGGHQAVRLLQAGEHSIYEWGAGKVAE